MFSSSRRLSSSTVASPSNKYSLQGLRHVYAELLAAHKEAVAADRSKSGEHRGTTGSYSSSSSSAAATAAAAKRDTVVELIRSVSEIIIYGEQHAEHEVIFDYFCEKNMLALLTDMMKAPWNDDLVKMQIVQTLAILVQNVCNETSLYYLLSNNFVNEIIMLEVNLSDTDLVSQFVSFLKTLSLRLNVRTVQFFLDDRTNNGMPLYDCVLRFINQGETMVRTSALTVVLNLFRVEDEGLRAFLLRPDKQNDFFGQLGQLLQNQTSQLLGYVLTATINAQQRQEHLRRVREEPPQTQKQATPTKGSKSRLLPGGSSSGGSSASSSSSSSSSSSAAEVVQGERGEG